MLHSFSIFFSQDPSESERSDLDSDYIPSESELAREDEEEEEDKEEEEETMSRRPTMRHQ